MAILPVAITAAVRRGEQLSARGGAGGASRCAEPVQVVDVRPEYLGTRTVPGVAVEEVLRGISRNPKAACPRLPVSS